MTATVRPMVEMVQRDGRLGMRLNLHAGQRRAWDSGSRFVAVIAGTQSGKTTFGPHWLHREIARRGPGDYIVATPTYPLLNLKALPEFIRLFESQLALGHYSAGSRRFAFSPDGIERLFGRDVRRSGGEVNIFFGHANDPDSLESATAKAAWLDEAGQKKFRLGSWEAILRRLSINRGRVLITTTPYNLGWLKTDFFNRWRTGDADYDVVNFRSIENPAFPREEYERAKRSMPGWRFRMMYDGRFESPAGMIYDCWDEDFHLIRDDYKVPATWPVVIGLDFGGVNTAAVYLAQDPGSRKWFAFNEYHGGNMDAKQHVKNILAKMPVPGAMPLRAVGGANSEEQWRREFTNAGLPVHAPDQFDVEVGINRVYAGLKTGQLFFSAKCKKTVDDVTTYSREVDEKGNPTDKIEDKEIYHHADGLRYGWGWISRIPDGIHFSVV